MGTCSDENGLPCRACNDVFEENDDGELTCDDAERFLSLLDQTGCCGVCTEQAKAYLQCREDNCESGAASKAGLWLLLVLHAVTAAVAMIL